MKRSKLLYALTLMLGMVFGALSLSAADYSGYYVGMKCGQTDWSFFGSKKIETQPDANGIATFNITDIGEWFMIKVWDGAHNTYLYNYELTADEFVTPKTQVDGNEPGNSMHVPSALRSGDVVISVDCAKNQVKIAAKGGATETPGTPDTPDTPTDGKYTVNFTNNDGWATVYAHFYNGGGGTTTWPGVAMTKQGDVWTVSAQLAFVPETVMFTAGQSGPQTSGFAFEEGATYTTQGKVGAPAPETKTYTIHYKDTENWANVYAYVYDTYNNNSWPGAEMTKNGDVYDVTLTLTWTPENVIFTNNAGAQFPAANEPGFVFEDGATYTKAGKDGSVVTPPTPAGPATIYWDNSETKWAAPHVHYWGNGIGSVFPGVAMTLAEGDVWYYTLPAGVTGMVFSLGEGADYQVPNSQFGDYVPVNGHIYGTQGDKGEYNGAIVPPTPGNYPEHLYIIGDLLGNHWLTDTPVEADSNDGNGVYTWESVTFETAYENDFGFFSFITAKGEGTEGDWDDIINKSDRYGAQTKDELISESATIVKEAQPYAWSIVPGTYKVVANLATMTLTISQPGQEIVEGDVDGDGYVNSVDLGFIINMIIGNLEATGEADINSDGYVNSVDLGLIINIICGN